MDGIQEPLVTLVFLPDGTASISVFHRLLKKHYQFNYNFISNEVITEVYVVEIESKTVRNYPIKSFYSGLTETCLTFYRMGECVTYTPEK